jgi:sugar (pentulose or hexulose) kinase
MSKGVFMSTLAHVLYIQEGHASLGIEFGSTRIKAVLLHHENIVLATGVHQWENRLIDGIWTYTTQDVILGLQACYKKLCQHVRQQYEINIVKLKAIGISGMMHGYIALDRDDKMLVPFRTWRNLMTEKASQTLSQLLNFPIPQRWTIAHLYQAIINREAHVNNISKLTTLAGYVHFLLTGDFVLGMGEASGVFPIDPKKKSYHPTMVNQFNQLIDSEITWKLLDILPKIKSVGENAGHLIDSGAKLLDQSGFLQKGVPFCPPEGDASTGMVATETIAPQTGNISVGTSVFAMIVLDKPLSKAYDVIDIIATPSGHPVAMVHVNNGSTEIDRWMDFTEDLLHLFGYKVPKETIYQTMLQSALSGDIDVGELIVYNYFSGEHITDIKVGRPLLIRQPSSRLNVANLMKANIFSVFAVLSIGLDILMKEENVSVNRLTGHGGLFKKNRVTQKILASALAIPVAVMKNASEGGAYGMAILAYYATVKERYESFEYYLKDFMKVENQSQVELPNPALKEAFDQYINQYKQALSIERKASQTNN